MSDDEATWSAGWVRRGRRRSRHAPLRDQEPGSAGPRRTSLCGHLQGNRTPARSSRLDDGPA